MMQERELCSPEIINRSPQKTSGHNRRFFVLLPMLNYNLYDIFNKTSSASSDIVWMKYIKSVYFTCHKHSDYPFRFCHINVPAYHYTTNTSSYMQEHTQSFRQRADSLYGLRMPALFFAQTFQ